jgi:hypothetical protein
MGTIVFEIYSTKSSEADDLAQDMFNAVDSERKTLWDVNVRKVNLDRMEQGHVMRDQVKIHMRTLEFSFQYTFTQAMFE